MRKSPDRQGIVTAGKVHFARGRFHASRAPTNGGIMPEEVEELRGEINQALPGIVVNVEGLCILRDAIALARARVKEHADRATRQDSIAQLESMMRCTDDALVLGLRGLRPAAPRPSPTPSRWMWRSARWIISR